MLEVFEDFKEVKAQIFGNMNKMGDNLGLIWKFGKGEYGVDI
jgi:hypothetical protein